MIIVNHNGDSAIVSSRICSRVFLLLGLKFLSDMEDFLFGMCILLSLVIFFAMRKRRKSEKQMK